MDRNRHLAAVAGLIALSCLVQFARIRYATVPALDAVRFARAAQRVDSEGLRATLRQGREEPLFPAWLWVVHEGVEGVAGHFRSSWAASVQLAAAIPLVLAVVPIYFLSVRLVGPAAGLAGSLLFCVLPEVARLGADGLSDSTHLFLFCLAVWATAAYMMGPRGQGRRVRGQGFKGQVSTSKRSPALARSKKSSTLARNVSEGAQKKQDGPRLRVGLVSDPGRSLPAKDAPTPAALPRLALLPNGNPCWLLVVGMLAALATLVRTEALMLLAALGVTLLAFQFHAFRRGSWTRLVAAGACLVLGCALIWGPYLIAVEATTPRAAIDRLLGRNEPENNPEREEVAFWEATPALAATRADVWRLDDGESMSFALKEHGVSLRRRGYAAAALELAEELADVFGYLIGVFAVFGVWRLRRRLVRPVDRFAQVYLLLFLPAVLYFAAREGYVSARHLLTLVVVGIGCAGYGLLEAGAWIASRKGRLQNNSGTVPIFPQGRRDCPLPNPARGRLAWAAVVLAMAVCLAEAIEPLHANRQGHRRAARWLAEEADAPGCVLDTRGWTGLYSGRTTYGYNDAPAAFGHPRLAYVVLERRELRYDGRRTRTLKHLLDVAADPAATFSDPANGGPDPGAVAVYHWNAERFSRWVASRSEENPLKEDRHAGAPARVSQKRL